MMSVHQNHAPRNKEYYKFGHVHHLHDAMVSEQRELNSIVSNAAFLAAVPALS